MWLDVDKTNAQRICDLHSAPRSDRAPTPRFPLAIEAIRCAQNSRGRDNPDARPQPHSTCGQLPASAAWCVHRRHVRRTRYWQKLCSASAQQSVPLASASSDSPRSALMSMANSLIGTPRLPELPSRSQPATPLQRNCHHERSEGSAFSRFTARKASPSRPIKFIPIRRSPATTAPALVTPELPLQS